MSRVMLMTLGAIGVALVAQTAIAAASENPAANQATAKALLDPKADTKPPEKPVVAAKVIPPSSAPNVAKPAEKAVVVNKVTTTTSTNVPATDTKPADKPTVAAKNTGASGKPATAAKPMSAWRRAYIAKHHHEPPVKAH